MTDRTLSPWTPDWKDRLDRRVEALGYRDIHDMLAGHPGKTYEELAQLLGDNFCAAQVYRLQLDFARATDRVREAAADSLVRCLRTCVVKGWRGSRYFDRQAAGAFADWVSIVREPTVTNREGSGYCASVWRALKDESPPDGWLPDGPDDPLLRRAFAAGWPAI